MPRSLAPSYSDRMSIKKSRTVEVMTSYDARALGWVVSRPNALRAAQVARMVSRLGDGPLYALLGALLVLFDAHSGRSFLAGTLLAFLIELPVYLLLKNLIRRPRPADAIDSLSAFIQPSDKFSFPSGHTAGAFVMATLVTAHYPLCAPVAYPLAMMVGVSRVMLGVHYPTDIAAGAFLGVSCAFFSLLLF